MGTEHLGSDMTKRERVSPARFTYLLNEELVSSKEFREGMIFMGNCDGYQFIAPGMTAIDRAGLDKLIYDRVVVRYTI